MFLISVWTVWSRGSCYSVAGGFIRIVFLVLSTHLANVWISGPGLYSGAVGCLFEAFSDPFCHFGVTLGALWLPWGALGFLWGSILEGFGRLVAVWAQELIQGFEKTIFYGFGALGQHFGGDFSSSNKGRVV